MSIPRRGDTLQFRRQSGPTLTKASAQDNVLTGNIRHRQQRWTTTSGTVPRIERRYRTMAVHRTAPVMASNASVIDPPPPNRSLTRSSYHGHYDHWIDAHCPLSIRSTVPLRPSTPQRRRESLSFLCWKWSVKWRPPLPTTIKTK